MNVYIYCQADVIVKTENEKLFVPSKNVVISKNATEFEFIFNENLERAFIDVCHPNFKNNIMMTALYDGLLIIPLLKRKVDTFETHLQTKTLSLRNEDIVFDLFGGKFSSKLTVNGFCKHYETELTFIPNTIEIYPHNSKPLVLIVLKGKKVAVISLNLQTFDPNFKQLADEINLGENIVLKSHLNDFSKHTIVDEWKIGEKFESISRKITKQQISTISELIPYQFLEEVRLGGDYQRFLSEKLKERGELIPNFLGKFIYYLPPIIEEFPSTITLVYKDNVKYLSLKTENSFIVDVCIESYPI